MNRLKLYRELFRFKEVIRLQSSKLMCLRIQILQNLDKDLFQPQDTQEDSDDCSFKISERPSTFAVDVGCWRSHCCVCVVKDYPDIVSAQSWTMLTCVRVVNLINNTASNFRNAFKLTFVYFFHKFVICQKYKQLPSVLAQSLTMRTQYPISQ